MARKAAKKTVQPKRVQLPSQPSKLIRLALNDLEKVEKMKKTYRVDMGVWHCPEDLDQFSCDAEAVGSGQNACVVCFAGSVMAMTLKADRRKKKETECFGRENEAKLEALNCFRIGALHEGLSYLDVDVKKVWAPERVIVVKYEGNKKLFRKQMTDIADKFKAVGM